MFSLFGESRKSSFCFDNSFVAYSWVRLTISSMPLIPEPDVHDYINENAASDPWSIDLPRIVIKVVP